jgi:hypothetical protein
MSVYSVPVEKRGAHMLFTAFGAGFAYGATLAERTR